MVREGGKEGGKEGKTGYYSECHVPVSAWQTASSGRGEHWSEVIMNLLGTDFRKNMLGYDSHPDDNNTREARLRMGEKKGRHLGGLVSAKPCLQTRSALIQSLSCPRPLNILILSEVHSRIR